MSRPNLPPVEIIMQRVRERLAFLAGCPSEAETVIGPHLPLGRFFLLDPFNPASAQVIGATGEWSARRLFQKFKYGYEADIEPYYDEPYHDHAETDARRKQLESDHADYQLRIVALLKQYAAKDQYIYDVASRWISELDLSEFDIDNKVRSAFRSITNQPRPTGSSGAKAATNVFRDLVILDLVADLLVHFEGLPATSGRNTGQGIDACSIVTAVWKQEFKGYTVVHAGEVHRIVEPRPLPDNAARNVWEKRPK